MRFAQLKPAQQLKAAVVVAAHEIWDYVVEEAKRENINIEVVEMNDWAVLPNTALEEGSCSNERIPTPSME